MPAESPELQTCFQVSQQVDVAALNVDAVGLQNLRQAWQAVDCRRREHDPAGENPLEQIVKGLRGFFARAQSSSNQSCLRVPD